MPLTLRNYRVYISCCVPRKKNSTTQIVELENQIKVLRASLGGAYIPTRILDTAVFAVEAFRSHVLDIEDDLHGQSCTLLTLQRIDWVINQLEQHYRFIADEGGLFYDNEGKSQQALLSSYAQKRQQAQQYLLKATAAKD